MLESVCEDVKVTTNFKPFMIFGGPSPKGTGGIQIFQYVCRLSMYVFHILIPSSVGSGETTLEGQTFQEFMGLLWSTLKDKYGEWLNLTYSEFPPRVDCQSRLLPNARFRS